MYRSDYYSIVNERYLRFHSQDGSAAPANNNTTVSPLAIAHQIYWIFDHTQRDTLSQCRTGVRTLL